MLLKAIVEEKSQWTSRDLPILDVIEADVIVWGCPVAGKIPKQMHAREKDLGRAPHVGNN